MSIQEVIDALMLIEDKSMQTFIPSPSPDGKSFVFMETCPGMCGVVEFDSEGAIYVNLDGEPADEERMKDIPKEGFVFFSHQYHGDDKPSINPSDN